MNYKITIYNYLYKYLWLLLLILPVNCFAGRDILSINQKVLLVDQSGYFLESSDTNYYDLLDAFLGSCEKFFSMDERTKIFKQFSNSITASDMYNTCDVAFNLIGKNYKYIKFFFNNYFNPYLVVDNSKLSSIGDFTGYYLPTIKISKYKDNIFKYPLYKRPSDLKDGVPYYTRKEINNGVLEYRNLELFYTDDLVDLFFLQIQGSGFGEDVDTGEIIKIGFDGKNNRQYTSIGKFLHENNLLTKDELNSIDIKNFLKSIDPDIAKSLMNNNQSYVFFKAITDNRIVGSQGVELIANTSLAVDTNYIPLGFPILLNTELTYTKNIKFPFNKIMVTHDTGSAIKGIIRGDIFFGNSRYSEQIASHQHSKGHYYILIPTDMEYKLFNGN